MTRGAQARPHVTALPDSESAMPRRSGPSCLGKSVKKINSYLIGPPSLEGGAGAGLGPDHGAPGRRERCDLGIEVLVGGRDPGIADAGR